MAKRPSVSEIIAAVRAAGPLRPGPETEGIDSAATAPESEPMPSPVDIPAASPPPASASTPSPGRPLTLKEKLAAAKSRPAGQEPATPPPSTVPTAQGSAAKSVEDPAPEPTAAPSEPPAPVPTGRPLTLKEKLAAAKSGAAPTSTGATPAAEKGVPPAKAVAKPANRALPPLEQMSDPRDLAEALRRTGAERKPKAAEPAAKVTTAAKKPTPAKVVPPRPTREAAAARASSATATEPERPDEFRRGFLVGLLTSATAWLVLGWATFAAGLGALTMMCVRFMFPNVLAEPPSSIKVGLPTAYEPEAVNEDFKAEWGFWIVRSSAYDGMDKIYAIQSVCTHLGCPPNWLPSEQKFKCPCHGSGFYISGVNFEGPAPRPLERFRVVMADDGQILVDKSRKFQEELGQWTDPDSFIPV